MDLKSISITCDSVGWVLVFFSCLFLLLIFLMGLGFLKNGSTFTVYLGWIRLKLTVPGIRSVFLAATFSGAASIAILCETPEANIHIASIDYMFVSLHEKDKRTDFCAKECCSVPMQFAPHTTNLLPDRYEYSFYGATYAKDAPQAGISLEFIGDSSVVTKPYMLTNFVDEKNYLDIKYYNKITGSVSLHFVPTQIRLRVCQGSWAASIRELKVIAVNDAKRCLPLCK